MAGKHSQNPDGSLKHGPGGNQYVAGCLDCREASRTYARRRRNNPERAAAWKLSMREWSAKQRRELDSIKLAAGCLDCGYNEHPQALQFDHRPDEDKSFDVGVAVAHVARERVLAEIVKCDIVCANCHAVRSAHRREQGIEPVNQYDESYLVRRKRQRQRVEARLGKSRLETSGFKNSGVAEETGLPKR